MNTNPRRRQAVAFLSVIPILSEAEGEEPAFFRIRYPFA
jgi:hypothetical protein